jgi:hypothetical protein
MRSFLARTEQFPTGTDIFEQAIDWELRLVEKGLRGGQEDAKLVDNLEEAALKRFLRKHAGQIRHFAETSNAERVKWIRDKEHLMQLEGVLPFALAAQVNRTKIMHLRALSRVGALRALVAVELHKAEEGAYPESLEALVPDYLNAVPMDPYKEAPFHYERTDEGFTLSASQMLVRSMPLPVPPPAAQTIRERMEKSDADIQ